MRKLLIVAATLYSINAFAKFETTEDDAGFGETQVVTLDNTTKFDLIGTPLEVGDLLPSAKMLTSDLESYDTSAQSKSIKIYSILTSVDTPVCVQQAIELSQYIESNHHKLQDIEFYAVSADTPFTQQRFIREHSLDGATYLSDSSEHKFGLNTGTQIKQLGLLSRSIIVVGMNNQVIYTQRVPELTTIPSLERAVKVALENR
ncbi:MULTISPECIES: redoxin family protein [Vibrio]|jgi:thiol peroxidase|uniref:Redoxin family protein n=2 Tax=Vibrio TaxID=662 RepID=A0ABV4KUG4_9VIBR|nr:redoxin family protein [Vibrio tasmaniensis]OEF52460.1 thioredoxin peroxidase [Vibrio tasmaniensis 1F-267]OEF64722.1 thioredoxin peroxidase [Vibrio tasmaniensis 1F-187]OEF72546.1 thioredoxin peroxidase [Vibrio tasmaniensis 1F-155]PMO86641.1 thioredoxin peroxidase [Vibrio tasmaniensis]